MYEDQSRADALQFAIEVADQQKPRNERDQVERNHLHELEELRNLHQGNKRAHRTLP